MFGVLKLAALSAGLAATLVLATERVPSVSAAASFAARESATPVANPSPRLAPPVLDGCQDGAIPLLGSEACEDSFRLADVGPGQGLS